MLFTELHMGSLFTCSVLISITVLLPELGSLITIDYCLWYLSVTMPKSEDVL